MHFDDMFKPYSPELRGDLEEYLRNRERTSADNLFYGPAHFFEIKDKGLMIPRRTWLRVNQSPLPDTGYFVNEDYLLESDGPGPVNMSLVDAEKGVYDPNDVLKDNAWSISGLKLWDDPSPSV